jgi:hypothetical protein
MVQRKWLSAAITAAAVALLIGSSGAQQQERRLHGFIKVGKHYINTARIAFVEDSGKNLRVGFGTDWTLYLAGAEAEGMRRWLEGASTDMTATEPMRRRIIKEGVDINIPNPLHVPQVPPEPDPR